MVYAYIPVTITNSESTATSTDFQQLVTVDLSYYSAFLNQDLSNTFFSSDTAGSTVVTSWLESGNTYPFNSVNFWLYLPDGIGASSSITVYLQVDLSGANHFNDTTTGVAPQLSSTYAEYDDGANIFNYYQRWGGLSALPANWSSVLDTVITFNSDYTEIASAPTTGGWYGIYLNPIPSSLSSTTTIWEFYGNNYDGVNAGQYIGTASGSPDNNSGYLFSEGDTTTNLIYLANDGVQFYTSTGYNDTNVNKIYGMVMESSTSLMMTINYNSIFTTSAISESPTYFDIAASNSSGTEPSTGIYVYWLRTRTYPPNGVMPSASTGTPSGFPYYNTTSYDELL